MRFKDRKAETTQSIEILCLILSLGAIFIQIWLLITSTESFLEGKDDHLGSALILSGLALCCCLLTAFTTTFNRVKTKPKSYFHKRD